VRFGRTEAIGEWCGRRACANRSACAVTPQAADFDTARIPLHAFCRRGLGGGACQASILGDARSEQGLPWAGWRSRAGWKKPACCGMQMVFGIGCTALTGGGNPFTMFRLSKIVWTRGADGAAPRGDQRQVPNQQMQVVPWQFPREDSPIREPDGGGRTTPRNRSSCSTAPSAVRRSRRTWFAPSAVTTWDAWSSK
jgi:hypothetical protein